MPLFRCYRKAALFLIVTLILAPLYLFTLCLCYPGRHRIGPGLVQFYSRLCLAILGVRIEEVKHLRHFPKMEGGLLIISNHASFLDIFVLSAVFRSAFVSKAEVRGYPVIGQIASLMGCIFVERGSSRERLRVLKTIAHRNFGRLAVFPQGTTARISQRLPFHRGLFKVAELNSDVILLPVTLHYREDSEIAWVKPQSIRETAMRVAARSSINLKVIVHRPVTVDDYRGKTADEISRKVERTVLAPLEKPYREVTMPALPDRAR